MCCRIKKYSAGVAPLWHFQIHYKHKENAAESEILCFCVYSSLRALPTIQLKNLQFSLKFGCVMLLAVNAASSCWPPSEMRSGLQRSGEHEYFSFFFSTSTNFFQATDTDLSDITWGYLINFMQLLCNSSSPVLFPKISGQSWSFCILYAFFILFFTLQTFGIGEKTLSGQVTVIVLIEFCPMCPWTDPLPRTGPDLSVYVYVW